MPVRSWQRRDHVFRIETVPFFQLVEDVVCTDDRVLKIRTTLALEAQRFVDVEDDDFAARKFHHEVADGGGRNRLGDQLDLIGRQFGISLCHLRRCLVGHTIEEIVGLDAEALPSRDLDERPIAVFARVVAQFARRRVRQCDHFVRIVNRMRGLFLIAERPPAPASAASADTTAVVSITLHTQDARPNWGRAAVPPRSGGRCRPERGRSVLEDSVVKVLSRAGRTSTTGTPCPYRRRSRSRQIAR